MTIHRRSAASRRKDQQIQEALVSGLSPAQVAAQLNLDVEQVTAAHLRVEEDLAALPATARAVQTQRTALRAIFAAAIASFRQSGVTKLADPRYLRVALLALSQERALLRLDERPRNKGKAGRSIRRNIEFWKKQELEHPEIAADYHHHHMELMSGMRLPRPNWPRTGTSPPTDEAPPSSI